MIELDETERTEIINNLIPATAETIERFALAAGFSSCSLLTYEKIRADLLKAREVSGEMIAFASPDSTFAVTKRIIEAAKTSIIIGIYDFSASYMKDLLLNAMQRGVSVSLMLDLNGQQGELPIFNQLGNRGAQVVRSPSCSGSGTHKYFQNAHEKIIVVDSEWVMIQSGNWSENSIPFNPDDGQRGANWNPGNRDMGLAIKSPEFAAFFTEIIKSDMRLELGSPDALVDNKFRTTFSDEEFFALAPPQKPSQLFPSKIFSTTTPVSIRPVLSPDNYMDVIPDFLRSARRSIFLEQQYIRAQQPTIKILLDSMRDAQTQNPNLDIRIIVAPPFQAGTTDKNITLMFKILNEQYNWKPEINVRQLNKRNFAHCHNKLIIIDEEKVLVGSQNWSTTAVSENREASLLVKHNGIAGYFKEIFEADWKMSETNPNALVEVAENHLFDSKSFSSGLIIPISPADYVEV